MSVFLSIIVPVYNEEATLPTMMGALHAACPDAQAVYVDDGSKDRSLEILRSHARPTDLVLQGNHGGKGSAIRLGLTRATGRYTVIQDVDLEYDPQEIHLLLHAAQTYPDCAVFGSRFLKTNPNLYRLNLIGNKTLTTILNMLFRGHLTDSYTCYKLLPTTLFQSLNLQSNGFELEAEIAAKCLKSGIEIIEVPITYRPRTIEEGKKIHWKDAYRGVCMMFRIRLSSSITASRAADSRSDNRWQR